MLILYLYILNLQRWNSVFSRQHYSYFIQTLLHICKKQIVNMQLTPIKNSSLLDSKKNQNKITMSAYVKNYQLFNIH